MSKRPVVIFLDSPAALAVSDNGKFLEQHFLHRGADMYEIEKCDFMFVAPGYEDYDLEAIREHLGLLRYPTA